MTDFETHDPEEREPDRYTPVDGIPPDHIGVLIAGAVFMLIGWLGLYQLVTTSLPLVGQRWLFFILLQLAITGTVLPFVRYLNVRFTPVTADLPPGGVIVRQSIWIGLFVVMCAWLQIPRVLTLPMVILVALLFIIIEAFLRSREIRNERSN
ncbi:MAG: hypothetical protein JNM70_01585 [Anaerolineae bacterium]|nr:hypothetical protein [Anaerolineae bacterium]